MIIRLEKTCTACPEQYDAFDEDGRMVGYLRLRQGYFTVQCPDVGGVMVMSSRPPRSDGEFYSETIRRVYLKCAIGAIERWYNHNNPPAMTGEDEYNDIIQADEIYSNI